MDKSVIFIWMAGASLIVGFIMILRFCNFYEDKVLKKYGIKNGPPYPDPDLEKK